MDQTSRDLNVTDYSNDLARMEQRIRMEEARTGAEAQLERDSYGDSAASRFDNEERNSDYRPATGRPQSQNGHGRQQERDTDLSRG